MYYSLIGRKGQLQKQIKIQYAKKIWVNKPTFTFISYQEGKKIKRIAGMPKHLIKVVSSSIFRRGIDANNALTTKRILYKQLILEEKEWEYRQAKEKVHILHQNLAIERKHRSFSFKEENKSVEKVEEEEKGKEIQLLEREPEVERVVMKRPRKIRPLGSPTYERE